MSGAWATWEKGLIVEGRIGGDNFYTYYTRTSKYYIHTFIYTFQVYARTHTSTACTSVASCIVHLDGGHLAQQGKTRIMLVYLAADGPHIRLPSDHEQIVAT